MDYNQKHSKETHIKGTWQSEHNVFFFIRYIFDLELPKDFVPTPRDGEVDCFYFWPLEKVKKKNRKSKADVFV